MPILNGAYSLYTVNSAAVSGSTVTLSGVNIISGETYTVSDQDASLGSTFQLVQHDVNLGDTTYVMAVLGSNSEGLYLEVSGTTNKYFLGNPAQGSTQIVDTSTASNFACFAAGTRIATARGEIAVEDLVAGDEVIALLGRRLAPIIWIGRSEVKLGRWKAPARHFPVRIQAGAIAAGQPARDLLLSPDHALLIDGWLVPVRHLVNGASIRHDTGVTAITYYHVELDRHDAVLADGVPAETFLDTGNRHMFAEAAAQAGLPDGSVDAAAARRIWAEHGCASLLTDGTELARLHANLLLRAQALGHCLTDDPALRIEADGMAVPAEASASGHLRAQLPAGTRRLRVISRHGIARETQADVGDARDLGVALCEVAFDGRSVALDDPMLAAGLHDREPGWRWTNGAAELRLDRTEAPIALDLRWHPGWRVYWTDTGTPMATAGG